MSEPIITPNLPTLMERALDEIEAMTPDERRAVLDYLVGIDVLTLMNGIANMRKEKINGTIGRIDPIASPLTSFDRAHGIDPAER